MCESHLDPEQSQAERKARRIGASQDFRSAQLLAKEAGMVLLCHGEAHYQLVYGRDRWVLNIYPGNQRLYHDKAHQGPYLNLAFWPWSLEDVVRAAIRATAEAGESACVATRETT